MRKADPARVARILREGFERWKLGEHPPRGLLNTVNKFADLVDVSPKLFSKWMAHGLRYVHKGSEAQLRAVCAELQIDWNDLWASDMIEVSPELIADMIGTLSELQTRATDLQSKLMKLQPKPPRKK